MTFIKNAIIVFLLCFALFSVLPINKIYAQTSNAGFVPGNIWYSKDPFEEGDQIKIYTVIFNPDTRELSGSVIFFDNDVFLGKEDFIAAPKGVKDVSLDWTATAGTHNIFGKIENAKFLISPGKYEDVYLAENETSKSSRTVAKKITDTAANISSIIDSVSNAGQNSISNIAGTIANNTPGFISQPVIAATNAIETLRRDVAATAKDKQAKMKKEIDALNSKDAQTGPGQNAAKTQSGELEKPMKFTELFALALFANTFDNKFIFYTLLFLFTFLLLRYLWKSVR